MDYSVFKTDHWNNNLSPKERRIALRELEREMARSQKRKARKIVFKFMDKNKCGYYEDGKKLPRKFLYINKYFLTSDEPDRNYILMNTVIHEGRHAYQDDVLKGKVSRDTLDDEKVKLWKMNSIIRNDAKGNFTKYRFQPREDDAYNFAYDVMEGLRYLLDDVYRCYMDGQKAQREYWEFDAKNYYGDSPDLNYKQIIEKKLARKYYDFILKKKLNRIKYRKVQGI